MHAVVVVGGLNHGRVIDALAAGQARGGAMAPPAAGRWWDDCGADEKDGVRRFCRLGGQVAAEI